MAASANPLPDPNQKLVRVFDTEQEPEAMIVSGLLESAGIERGNSAPTDRRVPSRTGRVG